MIALIIVICFLLITMTLRAKVRSSRLTNNSNDASLIGITHSFSTSRRKLSGWDPEINRKASQLYEPLIDSATKVTRFGKSRKLKFKGKLLPHKELVAFDVEGEDIVPSKKDFKVLLTRAIPERDTEYNYLNSSH